LHAHTGLAKQTGFHLHLPVATYEQSSQEYFAMHFVNYGEVDSPEINISTAKNRELEESLFQYSFGKLLYVLWVFGLVAIQLLFIFKCRAFYKFFQIQDINLRLSCRQFLLRQHISNLPPLCLGVFINWRRLCLLIFREFY